jgi:hypothetical protein
MSWKITVRTDSGDGVFVFEGVDILYSNAQAEANFLDRDRRTLIVNPERLVYVLVEPEAA